MRSTATVVAQERSLWRAVAVPSEHGGWGLTLEPVLLGLLVAFSWPGLAIGVAAMLAFLVRTPLKLALVDRRRQRSLPRTRLAWQVAGTELALIAVLALLAVAGSGWRWLIPVLAALPLVAVELWYDIRSRGRRLAPELAGAIGICAVAAAIAVAGGVSARLAVALWVILAARAVASIPFVRTLLARLHGRTTSVATSDTAQAAGILAALVAIAIDTRVLAGAMAVVAIALVQLRWVRGPVPPMKVAGVRQMLLGFAVVAVTAVGVLLS